MPAASPCNCFFRALGDQLQGSEAVHVALRQRVVSYMAEREDEFAPFVEDDESFGTYMARIKKDGVWAGYMEVVAASRCLGANLTIYQAGQPRWRVVHNPEDSSPMLHLSYHDGQHYNSVRAADDFGAGPPAPVVLKGDGAVAARPQQQRTEGGGGGPCDERDVRRVATSTACTDLDLVRRALAAAGGDVEAAVEGVIEALAALPEEGGTGYAGTEGGPEDGTEEGAESGVGPEAPRVVEEQSGGCSEGRAVAEHVVGAAGEAAGGGLEGDGAPVPAAGQSSSPPKPPPPSPSLLAAAAAGAAAASAVVGGPPAPPPPAPKARSAAFKKAGIRVAAAATASGPGPSNNKRCPCGSNKKFKACCGPAAAAAGRRLAAAGGGPGAAEGAAGEGGAATAGVVAQVAALII
ncbi:OTU domain-containing protein 3 [Tetrabaena socialis]|uniref:OTU domain-containing protein 3 n=1 Tax=Tetrabaena socialis TaxID=47790 RepID=A0A2J8A2P7_9CHLO|nr:OTU domain-containing protein 3 [Tetrabaena socialis]|eukprot:PNH06783.1 OTU domain-containing protein 3 [Tetrabaena socialis]